MDMAEVKAFNAELSALYDNRPPISKAKMGAITRGAIKAIKFYKHVVHSVEKFILKCKPEYKIPGLYVIDSIVRQSRYQFGADKDVFAPRFAKNMQQTFVNLLRCPPEDKRNIIRVLNLWQKNSVFTPEVIQPLFDMADPNHPIHQELLAQQQHTNGNASGNAENKGSPMVSGQHTPNMSQNSEQIRQIQQILKGHDPNAASQSQTTPVNFNRRLLNVDFEYESEDDGCAVDSSPVMFRPSATVPSSIQPPPSLTTSQMNSIFMNNVNNIQSAHPQDALGSILTNPEILRHLQSLQTQMMMANFPMQPGSMAMSQDGNFIDTSQPPPAIHNKIDDANAAGTSPLLDEVNNESDIEFVDDAGPQVIEIDGNDSRSPSPKSTRRRRSRSRDRSRRSRSRSRRTSRSRSRERRRRSRDRSRNRTDRDKPKDRERDKEREKEREREREKERERRKKGLPTIKKDTLSVCSTTLWVGHLSKLVQAEELSDAFGAIGDVISIDLVPPRGCAFIVMNRRRDASRAISKLNKHKMHGKAITVAWAPGKGVKGREWKDFWETEAGACYIPWSRLPTGPNDGGGFAVLDTLEEGGVLDEETVPLWLQRKLGGGDKKTTIDPTHPLNLLQPNQSGMMVQPLQPPQGLGVDTSCLPPPLAPLGFPSHPALPMPLPLLGFKPTAQTGLQALHLQAVLAQQQQLATQLLLAPPPRMPPHPPHPLSAMGTPLQSSISASDNRQDDAMEIETSDDIGGDSNMDMSKQNMLDSETQMSEKLKALVANPPPSFNIPPPSMPNPGLLPKPPLLSSQPFSVTSQPPPLMLTPDCDPSLMLNNGQMLSDKERDMKRDRDGINRKDRDRRDRERDRTRDRHDRDRDRGDRDRDRGDRDRERGERDRMDKERDRPDRGDRPIRERTNRWNRDHRESRDQSPNSIGRHGGPMNSGPNERSLQDRLWEMANGPGPRPPQNLDSPPRMLRNDRLHGKDAHLGDSLLGDGPIDPERRKVLHNPRGASPIMGPNGPIGMPMGPGGPIGPLGPNSSMGPNTPIGPNGPLGQNGPMGMMGPNISMMGRSPLPPMAPFRIGREEPRMRSMGPRGPLMRPGMWMDGPPGQFNSRFNNGPFNRPPFDGPPYDRPYDAPPYERPSYDRPIYDGPGRPPPFDGPPFDGPPFDGPPFDGPPFDGPRFGDGHPDGYYERNNSRGPRGPRGMENRRPRDRDNESRNERSTRPPRWSSNNDNIEKEKPVNKSHNQNETKKLSESDSNSKNNEVTNAKSEDASTDSQNKPNDNKVQEEKYMKNDLENNVTNILENLPVMDMVKNEDKNDFEAISTNADVVKETAVIIEKIVEVVKENRELAEVSEHEVTEGRGTPCRDEPIGASSITSDLADP